MVKAAVLYEVNKPLVVEDVDLDSPGPGEVKASLRPHHHSPPIPTASERQASRPAQLERSLRWPTQATKPPEIDTQR